MSDALGNYTLNVSATGEGGPWTSCAANPIAPDALSASDSAAPQPVIWYQLLQTTANGVAIEYPVVTLSALPMGSLRASPDPDDPTTLIFTWDVPPDLPLPITRFELTGRFLNDSDSDSTLLDQFGGGERVGRASIVPADDLSNPYTYSLTGFIDR